MWGARFPVIAVTVAGVKMKDKITTVPGPKHVVIQALLEYHVLLSAPRGTTVQVFRERVREGFSKEYKIDVLARYYHSRGKSDVLYEVQKDIDLPSFKAKMEELKTSGGEIIELNKCPDDILTASEWIKDRIVIPDFKRRKSE